LNRIEEDDPNDGFETYQQLHEKEKNLQKTEAK
jgi:hypothetical protein